MKRGRESGDQPREPQACDDASGATRPKRFKTPAKRAKDMPQKFPAMTGIAFRTVKELHSLTFPFGKGERVSGFRASVMLYCAGAYSGGGAFRSLHYHDASFGVGSIVR